MSSKNTRLFGKLFKKFRLRANFDSLPAFGTALADYGFIFEDSTFSRWQNGNRTPSKREVVTTIIKILAKYQGIDNLSDANSLMAAGGHGYLTDREIEIIRPYLVHKLLPTRKEVEEIRKDIDPMIQKWPYPITVYDFSWRVIHENEINVKLFRSSAKQAEWIKEEMPTIFEIQYASEAVQNKHLKGEKLKEWHDFLLEAIGQFKYEHRTRTKEKWYLDLVKKMMNDDLFRKLWKEAQIPSKQPLFRDYSRFTTPHPKDKNKLLTFDIFCVHLIKDPRFFIEFQVPADLETFNYFQKK